MSHAAMCTAARKPRWHKIPQLPSLKALMRPHLHSEAETPQQQPIEGGIHERPGVLQHSGSLCQQQGMEGRQLLEGLPYRACSCGQQQLQLWPCRDVLRRCQGQPEEAQGLIRQSPATQRGFASQGQQSSRPPQCRWHGAGSLSLQLVEGLQV